MPENRTIGPGGAVVFGRASIGFVNKPVNQDATVWLRAVSF